jgi:hypothetical protein
MFRPKKSGILCVRNGQSSVALNRLAAFKSLLGLPDVAGAIGERRGLAGF